MAEVPGAASENRQTETISEKSALTDYILHRCFGCIGGGCLGKFVDIGTLESSQPETTGAARKKAWRHDSENFP